MMIFNLRRRIALQREECPVFFPFAALRDPGPEGFDLLVGEFHAGRDRRHPQSRFFSSYAMNDLALFGVSLKDRALAIWQHGFRFLFTVKAKWNVLGLRIGTVAGVTFIGKNRTNVAVELYRSPGASDFESHEEA